MIKRLNKIKSRVLFLAVLLSSIMVAGCGSEPNIVIDGETPCFVPMKIKFQSSFCYLRNAKSTGKSSIKLYIQVQDNFGDSLKIPGSFRIELYRKAPRSQEDLGERLSVNDSGYAEFDLTSSDLNQLHWDRITRSYIMEFEAANLPSTIIAQATFIYTPNYRLTNTITLERESRDNSK